MVGFLEKNMPNFESRIQRQSIIIEQEKAIGDREAKERTEKDKKISEENEVTKAKTEAEVQKKRESDERYLQIKEIAYSQELKEALEIYKELFSSDESPIIISFSAEDENHPAGTFNIEVPITKETPDDNEHSGSRARSDIMFITWQNEATERKRIKSFSKFSNKGTQMTDVLSYQGIDAKPGLMICFAQAWFDWQDSKYVRVFNKLDDFLDFMAKVIIKKRQDSRFHLPSRLDKPEDLDLRID